MSTALADLGIAAVLLDIEGTTTPLSFVHDVLFPFARDRLHGYLREHGGSAAMARLIQALAAEHAAERAGEAPPAWRAGSPVEAIESAEAYARWLMARDRKSPSLKELQGWIWEEGYRAGLLKGETFPDVAPAIRRWRASGFEVAIYSSGSALAQRLLFGSTPDGDLTPLIAGFFDTGVGSKTTPDSYAGIVGALHRAPGEVLFVSDMPAELCAARTAGLHVRLSIRPGNSPHGESAPFETVRSLDELA